MRGYGGHMQPDHGPSALSRPLPRLDRHSQLRRDPEWLAGVWQRPDTRVLSLTDGRAPIRGVVPGAGRLLPEGEPRLHLEPARGELPDSAVYLGEALQGSAHAAPEHGPIRHVVAVPGHAGLPEASASPAGEPVGWEDLRGVGDLLPAVEAELLAQATAVCAWHTASRYCPACGTATVVRSSGWMRLCLRCGAQHFPRTDPAVIVAVTGPDDRLLLGSAQHWDTRRYSTFAGFVEAGEHVEDAVMREVGEETGVVVDRVDYLSSQAWPFPRSLMLGFRAHTQDRLARPDEEEIRDVRWFSRAELAEEVGDGAIRVPPRSSISRALIEHWYGGRLTDGPWNSSGR